MSKANAINFFNQFRENEKAEEIMKNKGRLDDAKSMAQALSEVAAEMGENISPEDFEAALEDYEAKMRQKTDSVVSGIEELEDDSIENVAGGGKGRSSREQCYHSFNPNEICGTQDVCNYALILYPCSGTFHDADCVAFNFCDNFLNNR